MRRKSILDAAEQLLKEAQVADITLRDIGRQAGIATSNVLRYFENREAVLLELLNREYSAWLDALPAELAPGNADGAGPKSRVRPDLSGRPGGVTEASPVTPGERDAVPRM